jgi:ATP-dependent Lon protease
VPLAPTSPENALAPGDVIEELPLFPLPNVVLFPRALLPLHVFEPRYRAMTADALAGSRLMSVVMAAGEPIDEHGHPKIASIAGMGEIIEYEVLADGRYNILVQGKARVELEELPFRPPYRRARATVTAGSVSSISESDRAGLVSAATRLIAQLRRHQPSLELEVPPLTDPGTAVDLLAEQLIASAEDRQRVLECVEVRDRVRLTTELFAVQEALYAQGTGGKG